MVGENIYSSHGRAYSDANVIAPLLDDIATQAEEADRTRSISANFIKAIKRNDIMRFSASPEVSGENGSYVATANELRAIAPRCSSTAWVIWNHLALFQHFSALFGPQHKDSLSEITAKREWVCQGASVQAINLCGEAMKLILLILGGNGLREGTNFERRYRDLQAMPLNILAHIDRITEQHGRLALGLETQNPF